MESKSAQFIGDALLANPSYPIEQIKFKGVNLEQTGLYRLLEAVNASKHIHTLHIGIISDYGLRTMSELLKTNKTLSRIEFQEDPAKRWTDGAKQAFTLMLKSHTELQTVKFKAAGNGEEGGQHDDFKHEIEFYTNKKLSQHKQVKKFQHRHHDCEPSSMFEGMLQHLEKNETKKMPVRKFFNNTFGTILNDALFALKKKQMKEPENLEIFTKKGSTKFVSLYLLENLP